MSADDNTVELSGATGPLVPVEPSGAVSSGTVGLNVITGGFSHSVQPIAVRPSETPFLRQAKEPGAL